MNTCTHCGETLAPESRYCPNCGTKVQGTDPQKPENMTKEELLKLLAEKDEQIAKEKEEKKKILEGVDNMGKKIEEKLNEAKEIEKKIDENEKKERKYDIEISLSKTISLLNDTSKEFIKNRDKLDEKAIKNEIRARLRHLADGYIDITEKRKKAVTEEVEKYMKNFDTILREYSECVIEKWKTNPVEYDEEGNEVEVVYDEHKLASEIDDFIARIIKIQEGGYKNEDINDAILADNYFVKVMSYLT